MKKQIFFSLVLFALMQGVFATSDVESPSSCNGQWTNCEYVYNGANLFSSVFVNGYASTWGEYQFNIPQTQVINGTTVNTQIQSVEVIPKGKYTFFPTKINVQASHNEGMTFGASHTVDLTNSEATYYVDVTNDFVWTPDRLNATGLKIKVTAVKQGALMGVVSLNRLQVRVIYAP